MTYQEINLGMSLFNNVAVFRAHIKSWNKMLDKYVLFMLLKDLREDALVSSVPVNLKKSNS